MASMHRVVGMVVMVVIAPAATGGRSWADEPLVGRARVHFEAGRAFHRLGRFDDAAREFETAYVLAPLPEMLMNIGTSYWRAGKLRQAYASYRRFLDAADAADPTRRQAERSLAELEQALDAIPPTTADVAVTPPDTRARVPTATATRNTTATTATATPATRLALVAPAPPASARRRLVLWTTTTAVAVVAVGVGLGLGLGLGLQQPSYPPTALGPLHFGP